MIQQTNLKALAGSIAAAVVPGMSPEQSTELVLRAMMEALPFLYLVEVRGFLTPDEIATVKRIETLGIDRAESAEAHAIADTELREKARADIAQSEALPLVEDDYSDILDRSGLEFSFDR